MLGIGRLITGMCGMSRPCPKSPCTHPGPPAMQDPNGHGIEPKNHNCGFCVTTPPVQGEIGIFIQQQFWGLATRAIMSGPTRFRENPPWTLERGQGLETQFQSLPKAHQLMAPRCQASGPVYIWVHSRGCHTVGAWSASGVAATQGWRCARLLFPDNGRFGRRC